MNYFQKKKLAFMSVVNSVKGFIRAVTGALPLTLEGCVDEESIIDYTLYGQSVQNGTPTPETPVEVESVGEYDETTGKYKIPIKVSGKNLFDMDDAMVSVDNWYYNGGSYSYGLNLEVGKQYRFSCDVINNPGVFSASICRKPNIADWSFTALYSIVGKSSTTGKKSYTFVADGTECLWLYCDGGTKLDLYKEFITENIKNFQLEEGTATDYEPYHEPITTNIYLDEPLRKVGDYADYIDFENGKVVRYVKRKRLTKAGTLYTIGGLVGFYTGFGFLDGNYFRIKGLSNREKTFTETLKDGTTIWLGVNNSIVYWIGILSKLGFTTLEQMNSWLSENETWIYWATKTPTEEHIELPNLPTFKGTSIITADTTVQPSNAEIEYYSTEKE